MTGAALPAPLMPPALVLPGIAAFGQISMDLDYLDEAPPRDAGAYLAAFELYVAAYRERPTGSLPSDEAALLSLLTPRGREADPAAVMDALSTRWILCSDGRLYRPQLAKCVLTTWLELALVPAALDVMAKAELLDSAVECLRLLRPSAEILDRVAAATGRPLRPGADDDLSDERDVSSAVFAFELAQSGKGGR